MKILFITSNRVGDAVLSTGLLAWLVDHHPEATFTIACGPYAADLFRATPRLDRLIVLKKKSWNRHWLGLWKATIGTRWDLIVDLRDSIVSRLLRASRRGYRNRGGDEKYLHKVVKNATALQLSPPPAPHIWLDTKATKEAAQFLPVMRPILALGPAANWPVKQWPIERFIDLALKLTAPDGPMPNAPVLVIADEKERLQVEPLLRSLNGRGIPVIGFDLLTVAACLKQAQLFIGNDSGLMHMASAVGIPTLGLFGPGYEEIYGPWGPKCAFVRTPESRKELLKRLSSPHARHPNLMESLTVEKVLEAAKKLLNNN